MLDAGTEMLLGAAGGAAGATVVAAKSFPKEFVPLIVRVRLAGANVEPLALGVRVY
jgi:hypothetical protein